MIVFFIILAILFFISLLFLLLCLSSLEIEISNFKFNSKNKKQDKLEHYLFCIWLKIFNKITWFKINIDKKKIKTIENSKVFKSKLFDKINDYKNIKEFLLENKKEIFKESSIKYFKELKINIKRLYLNMEICTTNSIWTSFVVATIASVISIILANNIKKYERDKYNYKIIPKYEYEPSFIIELNCIIDIKIVHIMNVIYMLIEKRRVEYDERTPDRRAYASLND